jgi:hypothetical protein
MRNFYLQSKWEYFLGHHKSRGAKDFERDIVSLRVMFGTLP